MKLLVVGLGYVGTPLAAELARHGHDVFAIRRTDGSIPLGVHVVLGDVTAEDVWSRLPRSFDQVLVLLSAGERSEAAYERTYLGGARGVRQAFPEARITWVSSTAVYADDAGRAIDDDTPATAQEGTAAVLLRAEAAVQAGPHLIVRPSGIYGPERATLFRRLLRAEITGAEREIWTNRIHRDDLVSALAFTTEHPDLSGTLLASDREPAQLGAMQDWVRVELAARRVGAPVQEGVPPVASAAAVPRAAEARKSRRVIASRLAALGFSWQFPSYREGYAPLFRSPR